MVKGRINNVLVFLLGLLVLHCGLAQAATYVVGGQNGWTYGVETWPNQKIFKTDDDLLFYYSPSEHNVAIVSKKEYEGCKASEIAKVYHTGKDRIKLKKGPNYFISSIKGQCRSGLKVLVHAK
ncbi:hypothetical protein Pint_11145 [Pistacia integerrima]|uniref:Uncharacterized protein n=1 Tax=Pistacia integerrima TaxID=434235 RepID=A0ACC0XI79_9ROSI|nr:hypothetical protein Pint_11145 [Pistacia integerrima]